MASQQPPGESKPINISINKKKQMASQQPPVESKTINIRTKNVQMASQQPPGESKTINISTKQCANGFTTASWRIQNY